MAGDDDIDGLAAEYVLGTLDPFNRKAVTKRREHDAALNEAIDAWERRLEPLNDRLPGIAPPADLYDKILSRIAGTAPPSTLVARPGQRRPALVVGVAALAACLMLALVWDFFLRSDNPALLVAQLHRKNGQGTGDEGHVPAFAVAIDARKLAIRPIAIRPSPGKSYALWLLQQGGGAPTLLGSVSPSELTTLPWRTDRPLSDFVNASLAIRVEQEGTSPTRPQPEPVTFVGTLVRGEKPKG